MAAVLRGVSEGKVFSGVRSRAEMSWEWGVSGGWGVEGGGGRYFGGLVFGGGDEVSAVRGHLQVRDLHAVFVGGLVV